VSRAWAVPVAAVCVAVVCAGCSSSPKATSASTSTTTRQVTTPTSTSGGSGSAAGSPVATVTSVSAAVRPKNPVNGTHGTPAERVTFTVSSVHEPLSCTVDLLRAGQVIGSTVAAVGVPVKKSDSVLESVEIEGIPGGTFAGAPSDANVECSPR